MSNRIHAKSLVNSVEVWWVALRSRSKQINTNQHYAVIEPSNIGRTPRNICAWELIAPTPFSRDTSKDFKYIGVCKNNVSTTIVKIKYVGNYAAIFTPNVNINSLDLSLLRSQEKNQSYQKSCKNSVARMRGKCKLGLKDRFVLLCCNSVNFWKPNFKIKDYC